MQDILVVIVTDLRSCRAKINDVSKLKELFTTARFARCRSRFAMPILLYKNKVRTVGLLNLGYVQVALRLGVKT